jgi:hypothetical protein
MVRPVAASCGLVRCGTITAHVSNDPVFISRNELFSTAAIIPIDRLKSTLYD